MANGKDSSAEQARPLARRAALGLFALRWVAAALLPLPACAMTPEEALLRDIRAVSQLPSLTDRAAVEQQFRVVLRNRPATPNTFSADVAREDLRGKIQWLYTSDRSINVENSVAVRLENISFPCVTPDAMRSVFGSPHLQLERSMRLSYQVAEHEVIYILSQNPERVLTFIFYGRRCVEYIYLRQNSSHDRFLFDLARQRGIIP